MFFVKVPHTIRCDHGRGDILGGYLGAGDIVHIHALKRNQVYEKVARHVLVSSDVLWINENGSNVCYIELRMTWAQKLNTRGYDNYRILFPHPITGD